MAKQETEPTKADYDTALRLTRVYIYDGAEPYAPSVSSFARLLAAHRLEVQAPLLDELKVALDAHDRTLDENNTLRREHDAMMRKLSELQEAHAEYVMASAP